MTEIEQLVATIKRELKRQRLTYRDVAKVLKLSEASVKRTFAAESFTLERIAQVATMLGFTLAEIAQQAAAEAPRVSTLTERQEKELIADEKLLLVAVCALNHWTVADILATYTLTKPEGIKRLVQLDRLRLIELLPNDRIRILVSRDFDWLPNGPMHRFFLQYGQAHFLASAFAAANETMAFAHGMLTDAAVMELQSELRKVKTRFAELHQEGLATPRRERRGTGLLLALREWEPPAFTRLRREDAAPAPLAYNVASPRINRIQK